MARCVDSLRCIVFSLNLFFWLAGVALLSLGIYIIYAGPGFFTDREANEGTYKIAAYLIIAAGAIMCFINCFGCCGAWKLSQGALVCFFFVLLLVFCLELAAALVAFYSQGAITGYVASNIRHTIETGLGDEKNREGLDFIQNHLQCCGGNNYSDYTRARWSTKATVAPYTGKVEHGIGAGSYSSGAKGTARMVPESCCNDLGMQNYPSNCGKTFNQGPLASYEPFLHQKGCAEALSEWLHNKMDLIIALCVIVGALQILAMALACSLCCCLSRDEKKYENF